MDDTGASQTQRDDGRGDAARSTPAPPAHRADLVLFAVYFLLYAGFMGLTAFSPETLAIRVAGGVNVAVAYGMGLILIAVILAGVAMFTYRHGDGSPTP